MQSSPLVKIVSLLLALALLAACNNQPAPADEQSAAGEAAIEEAEETQPLPFEQTVASITPDRGNDIAAAKALNEDTVGWLTVTGTTIDDPILMNPERNNDYYTTYNFDREEDPEGAYGIDWRVELGSGAREELPRNMALYAHNLDENPDGIFFAQLKKYRDPDFARENPYIYFSTHGEDMVWEIFAVYDAHINLPYINPDLEWEDFQKVLEVAEGASIYRYGTAITEDDRIVTLSTCTYDIPGYEPMPVNIPNDYRFVIMARLLDPSEELAAAGSFTLAEDPLMPDDFPDLSYMFFDRLVLGGEDYYNAESWTTENRAFIPAELSDLETVGSILHTVRGEMLGNWEATQLPQGTPLYRDPHSPDTLYASLEGRWIPYVREVEERPVEWVEIRLENDAGVAASLLLEGEDMERFWNLYDLVPEGQWLQQEPESVVRTSEYWVAAVRRDSIGTWQYEYFLATPSSVGMEVTIAAESGGYYYTTVNLYESMVALVGA